MLRLPSAPLALVVGLPDRLAYPCARLLRRAGFRVDRAATGLTACEHIHCFTPRLIVVYAELWPSEKRAIEEAVSEPDTYLVETWGGEIDAAILDRVLGRAAS